MTWNTVNWDDPDLRLALACRDIATVYRLLVERWDTQQRDIACRTRQSQSEVSEIINGRQVQSYDLLCRIADGLGVPRGWLGLAYDGHDPATRGGTEEVDEDVERRKFLALAGSIVVGAPVFGDPAPLTVLDVIIHPPERIGLSDVNQYAATVTRLGILDRESGGMAARQTLVATAEAGEALAHAQMRDGVRPYRQRTVSEVHRLAGWASGDCGLWDQCREHMHRALTHANGDGEQISSVLASQAAMEKDQGRHDDALQMLQMARIGAHQRDPQVGAVLAGLSAGAYRSIGHLDQMRSELGLARSMFAEARPEESLPYFEFYGPGAGLLASVESKAGDLDAARADITRALDTRPDYDVRCNALDTIVLATILIKAGEFRDGVATTRRALDLVTEVGSQRVLDRLAPLHEALASRRDSTCQDLAHRIATIRRHDSDS